MGTMKSTKDQPLATGVSNPARGEKKERDSNKQENKKYSNGVSNPCKDRVKNKQEKKKCTYCHKIWRPESACMKKTIDMMAQLLEKNNISLSKGARKKEGSLRS